MGYIPRPPLITQFDEETEWERRWEDELGITEKSPSFARAFIKIDFHFNLRDEEVV